MAEETGAEDWREQARLAGWHPRDERPARAPEEQTDEVAGWMLAAQAAGWSSPTQTPRETSPPVGEVTSSGMPRWAVAALASGAALVVLAGGLTALLVLSSDDSEPTVDRSPLAVTAAQDKTVTTITRSSAGASSGPTIEVPKPPSGPVLVAYDGGSFTARRPATWETEADRVPMDGYIESKWRNPADSSTTVKINWTPATTGTALSSAQGVRAQANVDRTVTFKETNLAGQPAVQWVFESDGERRVDFFVNACGTGFAVLGVSRPGTFQRYAATFRKVARSVAQNANSCR